MSLRDLPAAGLGVELVGDVRQLADEARQEQLVGLRLGSLAADRAQLPVHRCRLRLQLPDGGAGRVQAGGGDGEGQARHREQAREQEDQSHIRAGHSNGRASGPIQEVRYR